MARVSLLHDVLNRITYDAVMEKYCVGETTIAWQHLEEAQLPAGSLILLDRGYCDFLLLQQIRGLGHHFCVRMKGDLKVVKGASSHKGVMKPETRATLTAYYAPFNRQLFELLGWPADRWA